MKGSPGKHVNPLTNSDFEKLFQVAEISNFTKVEREVYEESLKHYRDIKI